MKDKTAIRHTGVPYYSQWGSPEWVQPIVEEDADPCDDPAWQRSGFTEQARVVNGFSDLILALYGLDRLSARTSIGVPDLPFGMPVEVDAVIAWDGPTRPTLRGAA